MHINKAERPLISVIMGVCFHRADTALLERAVDSILRQTYEPIELVICQWQSSPAACALLERLTAADARVKLVDGTGAESLAAKLNRCLTAAAGDWIARMDDDDWSHPERLARQMEYLSAHSETAFCGCNVNLLAEHDLAPCGQRSFPEFPAVRDFYMTQPYIHPALLFRRSALEAVDGYSEGNYQILCEDYDLLLRLYEKGLTGANLQEPLLDYTVSADGKSKRTMGHRLNEAVTRWNRFRALGVLPQAIPYVIKPLAVGLLPQKILQRIKKNGFRN